MGSCSNNTVGTIINLVMASPTVTTSRLVILTRKNKAVIRMPDNLPGILMPSEPLKVIMEIVIIDTGRPKALELTVSLIEPSTHLPSPLI